VHRQIGHDVSMTTGADGRHKLSGWIDEFDRAGWLERVTVLVEQAIDQLVLEFVELPYLHRVEHSLHCELYSLLTSNRTLGRPYSLVDGTPIQLVHKEWPETKLRPDKSGRGNFDLVVLDPSAVSAASLADFVDGRIAPAVVIEVGLNYGEEHLLGDMEKLVNSAPPRAYLVHLARNPVFHLPTLVDELIEQHGARVAAALAGAPSTSFRLLRGPTE
jgi:hypothetical protein